MYEFNYLLYTLMAPTGLDTRGDTHEQFSQPRTVTIMPIYHV